MTDATKSLQQRIDELEHVLENTRDEFNSRILALKSELGVLRESVQSEQKASLPADVAISGSYTEKQSPAIVQQSSDSVAYERSVTTNLNKSPVAEAIKVSTSTEKNEQTKSEPASAADSDDSVNSKTPEPGLLNVFISKFFIAIFYFILSRLSLFTAPFQALFHKLIKLYLHYKDQGKAPVFLMTVAGLLTLTVGFGYLLQYSFYTVFSDTLKALTGFVVGAGIIAAGALLARKQTDFREYAASIIALGVIFNYLTAYFIGPYYGMISESSGFLLLMAVTLSSFVLALIYETRVVAFVTLVGGVFTPFIIGDMEAIGLVFLLYLFVLSCANLYLSHKIKWPALSHIMFVLSLSVIEYIGISKAISSFVIATLLSGFFYMYVYYWSFQGLKIKTQLSRYDVTLLVSNVFYFIYAMLQVSTGDMTVASILLIHAVILAVIVLKFKLLKTALAPVYFLMAGLLVATSVFVLAPVDVSSVIWAMEGLILAYIGFQYQHKLIRAEGYAIYLLAMLGLLWHIMTEGYAVADNTVSWYWTKLLTFGFLSFLAYRLIERFKDSAEPIELKAAFVQNEIYTLWGAAASGFILAVFLPALMSVLLVLPMLWCFYRAAKFRLRFAQLIGFYLFVSFVVNFLAGMVSTDTTFISQQSLTTWILMAETLFFSWALHFYYQRSGLQGRGEKLAAMLHQLVFYVPIVLLVLSLLQIGIRHIANQETLMFSFLWLDFIVVGSLLSISSWVVNKTESLSENESRLPHQYILSETLSLYLTSFFLYTIAILFKEWMFTAAAIPLLFLLHRSLKEDLPLTEKLAWAHFLLFVVMTWFSYQAVGNLHFTEQSLATQIAWAEVLLCAWALQWVYEYSASEQPAYHLAVKVRIGVYLLIPLLFLPRIFRLYTEYVPVFIWLSFAVSWLMYKKLKIEALLIQLNILFFVAVLSTVLMALNAVTGAQQLPGLAALIAGVTVLTLFHYSEKTISRAGGNLTRYTKIALSSPYFYGFALAAFSYALSGQIALSLLISVFFFIYMIQQRRVRVLMRSTMSLAYLLVWSGLIAIPVLVFIKVEDSYLSFAADFIALAGLWYITHQRHAVLSYLQKKSMPRNTQLWLFHGLIFIGYSGMLNLVFDPWSVGTSIAMLVHAVVVLFLTLIDGYKGVLRLSIALYALTAAKVLLHDMNDFSHIHKVIALMCMGTILMLAAYLFQKVKNTRVISMC
ncbi:MAG: DUF2339 domain-containing protein [Gammaproteobacteria bacterium]|nr:DUF2339 domain-containing protein [Gammaproteobacteria bacterium]